jgi:short-subunit dehydrogenase involved in D-alanine esterification of teichoic acids
VAARDESKLQQLASQLPVVPYVCDLNSPDSVQGLAHFVATHHPDLRVLINNAGIQRNYSFRSASPVSTSWIQEELQTNLAAPIHLTTLLLPLLRQHEGAGIVNITSALGWVPKNDAAVYCASKAGLHLFTRSLRLQMDHPTIHEVIPPLVDTRMTAGRGRHKISPAACAQAILNGLAKNQTTIRIGKVQLLYLIDRFWPAIASRLINAPS